MVILIDYIDLIAILESNFWGTIFICNEFF